MTLSVNFELSRLSNDLLNFFINEGLHRDTTRPLAGAIHGALEGEQNRRYVARAGLQSPLVSLTLPVLSTPDMQAAIAALREDFDRVEKAIGKSTPAEAAQLRVGQQFIMAIGAAVLAQARAVHAALTAPKN